jgi:predicted transposase YbfD/YdcC
MDGFRACFAALEDPRRGNAQRHELDEIDDRAGGGAVRGRELRRHGAVRAEQGGAVTPLPRAAGRDSKPRHLLADLPPARSPRLAPSADLGGRRGAQRLRGLLRPLSVSPVRAGRGCGRDRWQDRAPRRGRPRRRLARKGPWPFSGLGAVGKVTATREQPGRTTTATRYYLLSRPRPAARFLAVVRAHWQIENCLHWVLDVVLDEDRARARKDHAPENLARLRRFALNVLRANRDDGSTRGKIKRARWDDAFLLNLLATP